MIFCLCIGQDSVGVGATPLLYETMWAAAAMVQCPNEGFDTLYDEWLNTSKKHYNGVYKPNIGNLGSGSDFTGFLQLQGISSANLAYVHVSAACNVAFKSS